MKITRFEDVIAWQKGRELNRQLFTLFNKHNNYSFKDQILRASLSITNNIAEGFDRNTDKELRNFLIIARGSTAEVRSMLYIAQDCDYIDSKEHQELSNLTVEIGKLLTGFIKKLG